MSERVTVHDRSGDHELVECVRERWIVVDGVPVLELEESELVLVPITSASRFQRVRP